MGNCMLLLCRILCKIYTTQFIKSVLPDITNKSLAKAINVVPLHITCVLYTMMILEATLVNILTKNIFSKSVGIRSVDQSQS